MMRNALTIDVEDWYTSSLALWDAPLSAYGQCPAASVVANTRRVMDLLDEYGHRATFFVLGTVAAYYPELVREIHRRGHEVATHGYSHRLVYQMALQEFQADLSQAVDVTLAAIGDSQCKITGFRAPYFSLTRGHDRMMDCLITHGIRYDSSIFPIRRGLYGDPGAPASAYIARSRGQQHLWEFPPSTVKVLSQRLPVAGGGYLRLFPYLFIRWGLQRLNRAGHPAVVYMHPYEIDPTDLRVQTENLKTSRFISWSQALGRKAMEKKFRRLLGDFQFRAIREVFPE